MKLILLELQGQSNKSTIIVRDFSTPLSILEKSNRQKKISRDFPGGAVVKNPPANAGDTGSIPGPGRSHMPRSN